MKPEDNALGTIFLAVCLFVPSYHGAPTWSIWPMTLINCSAMKVHTDGQTGGRTGATKFIISLLRKSYAVDKNYEHLD